MSVIIPVYNGQLFLRRAIDSVISQTYTNKYEVILLDDGSTDNTSNICKEYENHYPFVRYYYHENMGISKTRERAIELAKGDYLCWVDSDDTISSDLLKFTMTKLEETDADICAFSYQGIREDGKITNHLMEDYSLDEWRKRTITGKTTPVWSYISRRELWLNEKSPWQVSKSGEDSFMTMTIFEKAKKIVSISPILYFHIEDNPFSIMHTSSGLGILGGGYAAYLRFNKAIKRYPDVANDVGNKAIRWLIRAYCVSVFLRDLDEGKLEEIRTCILEIRTNLNYISFRNKVKIFLISNRWDNILKFLGKLVYDKVTQRNKKWRKR